VKLSIKTKLIGGFLIVLALLVGIFVIGFYALNSVNAASQNIYQNSNENYLWQQLKACNEKQVTAFFSYMTADDPIYLEEAKKQYISALNVLTELKKVVPPERQKQLDTISTLSDNLALSGKNTTLAFVNNDTAGFKSNLSAWLKNDNEINTAIDFVIDSSKYATDAALTHSNSTKNFASNILIFIAGFGFLFAIGIAIFISENISSRINKINKALMKMSCGDLTENVAIRSSDEIGAMVRSYGEIKIYLSKLVTDLKENAVKLSSASDKLSISAKQSTESTKQVATSAQQMAKGAQGQSINGQETVRSIEQLSDVISQVSQGAKEQSSGVQKTIYAINEVSEKINQVTENASQAARGAKQAGRSAQTSAEKDVRTLAGMDKIKFSSSEVARKIEKLGTRSNEIGRIVAIIDDIASQTNLLALNAAIEAARAGDQGRGFAVVSDEVRKLAERTATATKEIAELISSVQKGVNEATRVTAMGHNAVAEGYMMAVQTEEAIDQIQKAATEVDSQIEQISSNIQQVSPSTNRLVKEIDSMGNVTEKNAAYTDQMTSTAGKVSKSVKTVAGIAQENSAATKEVSESAEEMRSKVQEIVDSSRILKEMALSLERSVSMFKIGDNAQVVNKKNNLFQKLFKH
jgi:methyl-accepting chemotaxis protein